MKKTLFYLFIATELAANAATVDFTYNFNDAQPEAYAVKGNAETIDVAIHLSDPGLTGKKIMSIRVPIMGDASKLEGFSAFLTSELKTKNTESTKINNPDICSIQATVDEGIMTATFENPYVIPKEGVYVGYSLTVPDMDNVEQIKPVAVVEGAAEGAFYYHSTDGQLKWRDLSDLKKISSAMTVVLEGDFPSNAVSPRLPAVIYAAKSEPTALEIEIINKGLNPVTSIAYSYEGGGISGEGVYDFPEAIPARYGIAAPAVIDFDGISDIGSHSLKVNITKVNGMANENERTVEESPMEVLLFMPKNRPLVEEYTGLKCGWCPGGYVTLRQMADKYGHDSFVAASFHVARFESGAMVCMKDFPYTPSGYPASQINRTKSPSVLDIPGAWEQARKSIPEGEIEITLDWNDDSHTILTASSRTRFLHDSENSTYQLAFMLVADGLSDPGWAQYNAYCYTDEVDTSGLNGPYWDLFVGQEADVYDLIFDDIVVYFPNQKGISGSLPNAIMAGEEYEYTFEVNTPDITNIAHEHIVKDFGKTRVIGLIIDTKTGAVVNSVSSNYAGQGGTQPTVATPQVVSTFYHDLTGRSLNAPLEKGVTIVTEIMDDGTSRCSKHLR